MNITDSQKKVLAKLKYRDPYKYAERLTSLDIKEAEIQDYIDKEASRIATVEKIKKAVFNIPTSITKYHNPSALQGRNRKPPIKRIYIMVDGDNNPYENMTGYDSANAMYGVTIVVFVAGKDLANKYRKKYPGINVQEVTSGYQAVDNRIKGVAGSKAKNHEYDELVIVSGDQGYRNKIWAWKQKYHLKSNQIRLCKSISSAINS